MRHISFRSYPLITPALIASGEFPSRQIIMPTYVRRWVTITEEGGAPEFGIVIGKRGPEGSTTEKRSNFKLTAPQFAAMLELTRYGHSVIPDPYRDGNTYSFRLGTNDAEPADLKTKRAYAGQPLARRTRGYFTHWASHVLLKFDVYEKRMVPLHSVWQTGEAREKAMTYAEWNASRKGRHGVELREYVSNICALLVCQDGQRIYSHGSEQGADR